MDHRLYIHPYTDNNKPKSNTILSNNTRSKINHCHSEWYLIDKATTNNPSYAFGPLTAFSICLLQPNHTIHRVHTSVPYLTSLY